MWSQSSVDARSWVQALLACSGVALVVVVLTPPCPSAGSDKQTIRVGLFGDSLAVQSEPYFNFIVQAGVRADVTDFSYGGTAACDWLSKMRRYARTEHPQAVVFEIHRQHIYGMHEGLRLWIAGRRVALLFRHLGGDQCLARVGDARFSRWHADNPVGVGRSRFQVGRPQPGFRCSGCEASRSSDLCRRGESGRGASTVLCLDVAVPVLRAMHRSDDRRGEDQRRCVHPMGFTSVRTRSATPWASFRAVIPIALALFASRPQWPAR